MSQRIKIDKVSPAAYKAMMALENYASASRIDPLHRDLIYLRASQINGCTYCMDKHARDARAKGETEQRLYTVSSWRDTPFFSEEEQAILALTEEITLIHAQGVSEAVYTAAARLFDEEYLAQLIMTIITINAWNRIGVSTHMQPAAIEQP
ncbi:carboxymuconolactone decarboxylase family protein [Chitinophaga lutea]